MDQTADEMNRADRTEEQQGDFVEGNDIVIVAETVEYQGEETERLRADIEETRSELGQTINEIQERLSPEHIMGQVKDSVREATLGRAERAMQNVGEKISNATEPAVEAMGRAGTAIRETSASLADNVRQNPIPAALIGLGLGMLIVNRFRRSSYDESAIRPYGPRTGSRAGSSEQAGRYVAGTLSQAKETATDLANRTTERISQFGDQAREGAVRVSDQFGRLLRENPLAVGAAAIAVGAAVGLALPTTNVEKDYMGSASERLVGKAQQVAREAMDKVENAATEGMTGTEGKAKGVTA